MSGVSKEQIAQAKEWDLLSYLQTREPNELMRCGPHEYCTRTHDSLKISKGKWCWNSRGIGGRTALDYLIKVRGISFTEAVHTLCGFTPSPPQQAVPTLHKPFRLPEAARYPVAVVAYLQSRGIHPEIIGACLNAGILYESKRHRNCVFVGRDMQGQARSASLRGTQDSFRIDTVGSDKCFGFYLPAGKMDCSRLAVAESPIDALSLATLVKLSGGDWRDNFYLSLGGTGEKALLQFLYDHPMATDISLCLDNDQAGLIGMNRLEQAIQRDSGLSRQVKQVYHNPPPAEHGKDYNELLCSRVAALREQSRHSREGR
ncbi:MAG: DUF3991 domain-containing protein [Provencibacterium sp.]|nr:DUF3991 domain-containing protein [Provencibacterium sp.]